PGGGYHRDAAPTDCRSRRGSLLRHLPAVLPDLLDLVRRQAQLGRLGAAVGRSPRDPFPAAGLPAFLPVLPGAALATLACLGRARCLPASAAADRSHAFRTGSVRSLRRQRLPVARAGRDRPLEAVLFRIAVRGLVRGVA